MFTESIQLSLHWFLTYYTKEVSLKCPITGSLTRDRAAYISKNYLTLKNLFNSLNANWERSRWKLLFLCSTILSKVNCVDTLQRVLAEIYKLCLLFCQGSLEITQLRNSFFWRLCIIRDGICMKCSKLFLYAILVS